MRVETRTTTIVYQDNSGSYNENPEGRCAAVDAQAGLITLLNQDREMAAVLKISSRRDNFGALR